MKKQEAQELCLDLSGLKIHKGNIKAIRQSKAQKSAEQKLKALEEEVLLFLEEWFRDSPYMEIQTSGSTGKAKRIRASKEAMLRSAELTCQALELQSGDTAILSISPKYIGGMMMIVRAMLQEMKLILAPVQANPLLDCPIHWTKNADKKCFIALVPMQVQAILAEASTKALFKQIDKVIIGGASLNAQLIKELKDFPNDIYSTYGMTETLSHIALRQVSGQKVSRHYYPLEGVVLSLSEDESLNILAPHITDEWFETNDLVKLYDDHSFEVLGRKDNVVNSGGVKLQIETLEETIKQIIPCPIALSSVADDELGEALVLLIGELKPTNKKGEDNVPSLIEKLKNVLPRYSAPKHIIYCEQLPLTPNGKIDRIACKRLSQAKLEAL